MEIIKLTKDTYDEWDEFADRSDDAWWYNTTQHLNYILNYKPENKSVSKSFMVYRNKELVATCSLIKEGSEFSFGGDYGPTPAFANGLTEKEERKIIKFVFNQIDKLAKENNIKRIKMRFPVLSESFDLHNYLIEYGYLDTSISTNIINLLLFPQQLRANFRHGHDYDIDKASKVLKSRVYDKNNITKDIFDKYKYLHFIASGRKTRPDKTFDILYDNIKNGYAFLVGALLNDSFVSFAYFTAYKECVYYGSSCNKPNVDLPLAHFVQWEAIKYMNTKYKIYEIGWQQYGNTLSDFPSQKEINIGRFKRGFGGYTVPLFRGEKYYDKDFFLKIQKERINRYVEQL